LAEKAFTVVSPGEWEVRFSSLMQAYGGNRIIDHYPWIIFHEPWKED
jgi:hypothetical protein